MLGQLLQFGQLLRSRGGGLERALAAHALAPHLALARRGVVVGGAQPESDLGKKGELRGREHRRQHAALLAQVRHLGHPKRAQHVLGDLRNKTHTVAAR